MWKKVLAVKVVLSIYNRRQTAWCGHVLDAQAFFFFLHLASLLLNSGTEFDCCS